jgi:hypothetical protein
MAEVKSESGRGKTQKGGDYPPQRASAGINVEPGLARRLILPSLVCISTSRLT